MLLDAKNVIDIVRESDSSINTFHAWAHISIIASKNIILFVCVLIRVKYSPRKVYFNDKVENKSLLTTECASKW